MPRVNLRTMMAGPDGVRQPGWHEVDAETAAVLIEGGYATADTVETASMQPSETAAMPKPSRKKA